MAQDFMHLTNYSVNKYNEDFVEPDDIGAGKSHKRNIKWIFDYLSKEGFATEEIWAEIKKVVIKTFNAIEDEIAWGYHNDFPKDFGG